VLSCRDSLFELLLSHCVPLPRALWLVKAVYCHQPPQAAAQQQAAQQSAAQQAAAGASKFAKAAAGLAAAGKAAAVAAPAAGGRRSGDTGQAADVWGAHAQDQQQQQELKAQHWTHMALQHVDALAAAAATTQAAAAAAAAAASDAAAAAAAAAATAAAGGLVGCLHAGTPAQQHEEPVSHTEQQHEARRQADAAAAGTKPQHAAAAAGSDAGAAHDTAAAAAAAAEAASSDAAADEAKAAAAAASAAAGAAEFRWRQALRLASYSFEQGLLDAGVLLAWVAKRLGSAAAGSSTPQHCESAVLLAGAAVDAFARCHSFATKAAAALVSFLGAASTTAGTSHPAEQGSRHARQAPSGTAAAAAAQAGSSGTSSMRRALRCAHGLLQQLVVAAPASLVSLDCLPQLCTALLGPSEARGLLYGGGSSGSSGGSDSSGSSGGSDSSGSGSAGSDSAGSDSAGTGGWRAPPCAAGVAQCTEAVVAAARRMAASVSPRLLFFSAGAAYAALSGCCLAGDVPGALAALAPALKGVRVCVAAPGVARWLT
jgi:hypothetical protein